MIELNGNMAVCKSVHLNSTSDSQKSQLYLLNNLDDYAVLWWHNLQVEQNSVPLNFSSRLTKKAVPPGLW